METLSADLRTEEGVERLYGLLQGLGRPVDVLCANAGVGVWGDFTRETELREELDMLRLNVLSQVHLVKLVACDMVERDSGHILITASVAGAMPGPRMAVYAGSKAFLNSFGHALRNELSDTNVGVTILAPGPTETNFFERADMEESKVAQQKKDDPADVARAAYKALQNDRAHVVTGAKNKLQTGMAAVMPDKAKAAMHGNLTKPADE